MLERSFMEKKYYKWDYLIALFLTLLVGLVAFRYCDGGHSQGDDFAAYILEARAIAEGTLEEQIRLNPFLHPSTIFDPELAQASQLTYAWGLPLILSFVYRLVGFDLSQPLCLFYYKIPGILSYALFAGVLYLFYRRRFGCGLSALLCFCMVFSIFKDINQILTDFPFLLLTFLCFLLFEVFASTRRRKGKLVCGLSLAVCMWMTVETRLNGFTVTLLILLQHLFLLWKRKPKKQELWLELLPHGLLLAMVFLSCLVMPVASSNLSDVGLGYWKAGFMYFGWLMKRWLYALTSYGFTDIIQYLKFAALALFLLGIVCDGRQQFAYAVFIVGTVLVNVSLPYYQGLRYFYNILPLILMFIACGGCFLYRRIRDLSANTLYRGCVTVCVVLALLLFTLVLLQLVTSTVSYLTMEKAEDSSVATKNIYSDSCREMYDVILAQTEEDAVIAFRKPRALYLNTGRIAFCVGINGHTLEEADYYLEFSEYHGQELTEAEYGDLSVVFANDQMCLYRCP